jgi:hypothetical protein
LFSDSLDCPTPRASKTANHQREAGNSEDEQACWFVKVRCENPGVRLRAGSISNNRIARETGFLLRLMRA